jgi:hypothetical protein
MTQPAHTATEHLRDKLESGLCLLVNTSAERLSSPAEYEAMQKWAHECQELLATLPSASASPTKAFVVIGGWDYEGFSAPAGIYSTKEKAEAAKDHARANHSYDTLEILEYDLNIGEAENG